MIIHRLRASGFQIMGDPMDLEFPEEGRIGILGPNESGKTTLLEAIEYALYGLRRGRAAEESRENIVTWGKEQTKLEIEFTSGQDRFLLRRVFSVGGGHKATLIPIVNGNKDLANALNSLTEIEAKLIQITGMDRESFTKLVYVKQKDLDALKDLARTKREQLVNKVMGIEVFDDATSRVKSDLSVVAGDIEKKEIELESVRNNANAYEEKLTQRKNLQTEIVDLKKTLEEKKLALSEAEDILGAYDWLSAFNSTSELIDSMTKQRSRIQQDINEIWNLKEQAEIYKRALDKYKPEVNRLESLRSSFAALESRLELSQSALDSLKARENEATIRAGLTNKDRELLSQNLLANKQREFSKFASMLVVCIALIALGVFIQPIISLLGFLFAALAAKFYLTYQKIDRILSLGAEIQALRKQITDEAQRARQAQGEIDTLVAQTGLKNREDVDLAVSNISEQIRLMTGQASIQGVEALKCNVDGNLTKLQESNLSLKLEELDRQVLERTKDIEDLEKTKPMSADTLKYDKSQHEDVKQKVETLRKESAEIDGERQRKVGTANQLDIELESLKKDYDRRPSVEAGYKTLQDRKAVLDLVIQEMGETSKQLRSKVIPHARFIINQILPTLTDGRYSEFEITEDLKFNVHSNEAGGYKPREVFSGGTQDQFLIALRLAFTQSILDSRVMADKYSLLMDECISSSDPQRRQGIFEVFEAMKKTFSQIFIIAHEDVSDFVDQHVALDRNQHGYTQIRSKSW